MGCGCGKNRPKRQQSSRIPATPNKKPCKKIEGVAVSPTMPSKNRKVALTKIKNIREEKRKKSVQNFWQDYKRNKK
tara:strand:- start:54 stop:281 length:228 start_codon:yes stop_codon:yes gene_type:complete